MTSLKKYLAWVEFGCWLISFSIIALFAFQIINTLFLANGSLNENDLLVRLYISIFFLTLPLGLKGARHSLNNIN